MGTVACSIPTRVQVRDWLGDLDQAAQKAVPGLPSDVREMINGDLQSMRDAVDASDWSAAQEAAASIAEVLDQTK